MKVSIIIPVYNCEDFINNCVNSVLRQSYGDYELILVDDGSTDLSGRICDEYEQKDIRVKVFHKSNGGASSARNKGIQVATGEYITFLDSDDYWIGEDFLQKIVNRIVLTNPDVLSYNYCKVYDGVATYPYFSVQEDMPYNKKTENSVNFIYQNNIWIACAWNKIINRRMFQLYDMSFREGVTAEDVEWCAKLAFYAERFDYLNVVGVGYVQRANSVSGSMTIQKIDWLIDNIFHVEKIVGNVDKRKQDFMNQYLAYQVGVLYYDISFVDNKDERKRLINEVRKLKKWLTYSKSKKIFLMNVLRHLIGFNGMFFLLGIIVKLKKRRN